MMNVELFKEAQFTEAELDRLNLLFWCLAWVFHTSPLDDYLRGILLNNLVDPAGGDPGWYLNLISRREAADYSEQWDACIVHSSHPELGCYEAWALADISGIEPETAYYTVEEVRHYIRLALDNIAQQHPERTKEVQEVIARYRL
ncbi:hypothetical protein [Herbaspirillum robiniae]|uniref:hypothetical protein n=1 Tax=Herbaspirillum robiniae TaxID=2014887 RepID=UPI003D784216